MTTKRKVVSLVRVSSAKQTNDAKDGVPRQQRYNKAILAKFDLESVEEFRLVISGTKVLQTKEYKAMLDVLKREDIAGLVVPSIDRWFRYDKISQIGDIVRPFEAMLGKTHKLVWCSEGELDLMNPADQTKILQAAEYASKERLKIR